MHEAFPVDAAFPDRGTQGPGQVRFYQSFAELVLADGGRHELPYAHAQVAWGGRKDELAVLSLVAAHGEVVRLYSPDRGLFNRPPEAWPDALRAQAHALTQRRRWVWAIVPGLAGAAGLIWLALQVFIAAVVALVPASAEPPIGKVFADSAAAGHLVEDRLLADATTMIGNALVAQASDQSYPFVFRIVDQPQANAFAFPGGQVLVTAKLLAAAGSADELAGILGHEIAHVQRRHVTRQLAQHLGLGLALALLLGDLGSAGTLAATYGTELLGLAYGRAQEAEADRDGARLAHAAGFDPRGLDAFFKRLQAEHGDGAPALLSSHPADADRIAAIEALAKSLGPVKAVARPRLPAWRDVQARAKALGGESEPKARPKPPAAL